MGSRVILVSAQGLVRVEPLCRVCPVVVQGALLALSRVLKSRSVWPETLACSSFTTGLGVTAFSFENLSPTQAFQKRGFWKEDWILRALPPADLLMAKLSETEGRLPNSLDQVSLEGMS